MRILWLLAGIVSFLLGLIGAFVPLLPTVPLMLLAAYFFARSSERLHHWLITHPRFGPAIQEWSDRRAIARPAKWAATLSMIAGFALSVAIGLRPALLALQAAVLLGAALFIWTRPDT